jgi:RNA recognition motif-containing protein
MGDENGEDSSVMRIGKRCYVGNLAWKTSWQDLKDKFRDVGNVVYANVMRDDGGKSFPDLGDKLLKRHAHALDVRHKVG